MTYKKTTGLLWLMLLSLTLLIVLQGLWLRTEYNSSVEAFSRETNIVFRSTIHQLSDSLFLNSMEDFTGTDSLRNRGNRSWNTSPENIRHISIVNLDRNDSISTESDTPEKAVREITISLHNPDNPNDSLRISRQVSAGPQDMRWLFTGDLKGYNKDSIALFYRRNLNPSHAKIPFSILEKEFSHPHSRQPLSAGLDTLPFTTSWMPFVRKLYAVEFHGAPTYLRAKLLPQAGFSLFTTLLIFTSFLLVFRSMRIQQKLLIQKDDFIGNITHELKTPVASVGVALEAIRDFDVLKDVDKTREYLVLAGQELKRLELMADKILKTSIHDYATEIRKNKSLINLEDIASQVQTSFSITAANKGIELLLEKQGKLELMGHAEHLTQMIYNLVDNAIKYAGDGRQVKIILFELPAHIVIEVTDNGPGIAAEHRTKVFEKFYRIPTGNIHNVKGYGLGLHYVKGVVKHHRGKISLDSHQGKGCRFVVKLPKA